jgi:putative DNA primase/helicase
MPDETGFTLSDEPPPPDGDERLTKAPGLPDLLVHSGDLPAAVRALCRLFAQAGGFFNRGGVPVILAHEPGSNVPVANPLTPHSLTMAAHGLCRPVRDTPEGPRLVTLQERAAMMTLSELGSGRFLPGLDGIATAPMLNADGTILTRPGYDAARLIWCEPCPDLAVPDPPTRQDAEAALLALRRRLCTFCFGDAATVRRDGVDVVDTASPPGMSESMALAALLTAVCRPSLDRAPGLIVSAPSVTGAGSGKGLLVRVLAEIAFGVQPAAITAGHDRAELDKRIASALMEASPVLFLDNFNGVTLRSDTLASAMTERPSRVRVMGVSRMVRLNSSAFVAVTGNGLAVGEDLLRRFLAVELDARSEDPEARPFRPGFLDDVRRDRPALLSAALTIWRWGRQSSPPPGQPLGSFETWAAWVRDPLLALGCRDPVERIRAAKNEDPKRREVADLFTAWWQAHRDQPVRASSLDAAAARIINPHDRATRYLATRLRQHVGTRAAGYVLTYAPGTSSKVGGTYALRPTGEPKPHTPFTPDARQAGPEPDAANGVNGVSGTDAEPVAWEIEL